MPEHRSLFGNLRREQDIVQSCIVRIEASLKNQRDKLRKNAEFYENADSYAGNFPIPPEEHVYAVEDKIISIFFSWQWANLI